MQPSSIDFIAYQKFRDIQIRTNPGDCLLGGDRYPEMRHFTAPKRKNVSRQNDNIPLLPETFAPSTPPSVVHSEIPSVMISSSPTYSPSNNPTEEILTPEPSSHTSMPSVGASQSPTSMPTLGTSSPTAAPSTTSSPTMTTAPTSLRSNSPTVSPTVTSAPTSEQSNIPTAYPTVTNAPTQTSSPTISPSTSSAPSQTNNPTSTSSSSVTDDKSSVVFEPSSSPSSVPGTGGSTLATGSPAVSSFTAAPTIADLGPRTPSGCTADDDGDFLISSSQGRVEELIIGYKYKMEINNNRASIDGVLPALEKSLLDRLLQTVFVDLCASRRLAEHNVHKSRRLSIVGASARPNDIISTEDFCESSSSTSDCSIIDGRMTVIANEATAVNSSEIETSICHVLNDDDFRFDLHPSILNLECVPSVGFNSVYGDDVVEPGKSYPSIEPAASDNIEAYSILVSAVSAIVIVLGIYGYRRRHQKKDGPRAVNHLDDSDVVNMSNSLSYEAGALHPTMDFTPIHDPSYTAQGGIGVLARHSYFPESIDENSGETSSGEVLEEVSLDELNMTTSGSDLLISS